jgi:ribosome-associated toxin RatA of RatAB toxin-antitoxin module
MGKRTKMTVERIIEATPEMAWSVISDMEGYAALTTEGISKVEVLEGSGEGMLRRCHDNNGKSWTETCPVWEEGRAYRFQVHTDAPDYPFPLNHLEGHWQVEPHPEGALIRASFEYELKFGIVGQMMNALMAKRAQQDSEFMLDQWEAKARAT